MMYICEKCGKIHLTDGLICRSLSCGGKIIEIEESEYNLILKKIKRYGVDSKSNND
jgi:hypothetical protein